MSNKQSQTGAKPARIVLANDLRSGLTVFLTDSGTWSPCATDAMIVHDADSARVAMQSAADDEATNTVTGPYLADCNSAGEPVDLRERLRVRGPSINYLAHRPQDAAATTALQCRTEG